MKILDNYTISILFFRLFSKINFFFQAHTAHGIHSPFVYEMVTNCLRKKDLESPIIYWYSESIQSKNIRLINRILHYYQLYSISTKTTNEAQVYILSQWENIEHKINELIDNQWIILLNIRKNKRLYHLWKSYCKHQHNTLGIDLFDLGILIKRKEQPKQNFKLKALK